MFLKSFENFERTTEFTSREWLTERGATRISQSSSALKLAAVFPARATQPSLLADLDTAHCKQLGTTTDQIISARREYKQARDQSERDLFDPPKKNQNMCNKPRQGC